MYNLTPLFVDIWQWTGQPRASWPAWVEKAVGVNLGTQTLVRETILWADLGPGFVAPVAPDWWIIRLPDETTEVMTPARYAERVQVTPIYQAPPTPNPVPSPAPAPVPTPSPSPAGVLMPPRPYNPLDHVETTVDAKTGMVLDQWVDASGKHYIGPLLIPSKGNNVILLVDVKSGDTDLLHFQAADGKFYVGRLSTWAAWSLSG